MRGVLVFLTVFGLIAGFSTVGAQTGSISYGSTISGTINDQRPSDLWQFYGQAGDIVLVFMNRTSGNLDTFVYLLNNSSVIIAKNDDYKGTDSAIINFALPYDGLYFIRAGRYGNTNGGYVLSLLKGMSGAGALQSTGGGPIQYGQFVRSAITPQALSETWTFYGNGGDVVSIAMTTDVSIPGSATLDPYLTLYDPNGQRIALDDDSRGAFNAQIHQTLPTSGTYRVVASSYLQHSFGAYSLFLSLETPTAVPSGSVRLGEFRVEWYCEQKGYSPSLFNNNADWACLSRGDGSVVFVLGQADYNTICQATYGDAKAFAVRDQKRETPAYNWSCYTVPQTAPVTALGNPIGSMTPKFGVQLNVRSGPGTNYAQIGRIDWKQTFPLLEVLQGWYVINFNGQRGYVSSRWSNIKLQ